MSRIENMALIERHAQLAEAREKLTKVQAVLDRHYVDEQHAWVIVQEIVGVMKEETEYPFLDREEPKL
jgi:hypothetical protein